jgi:hypothetical protein
MPKRKPIPSAQPSPALPPTVAAYFLEKLGAALEAKPEPGQPYSPSHPDFNIESGCGEDCKAAIDAAAGMLSRNRIAFGPIEGSPEHPRGAEIREEIVDAARDIVLCYVYG